MYEYDYDKFTQKEEPKIEITPFERSIEVVLLGMTAAALFFFFLKVLFF